MISHTSIRLRRAVLVLAPWAWFVLRDTGAWMEVAAVAVPPIGVLAVVGAAILATAGHAPGLRLLLVSTAAMTLVASVLPRLPNTDGAAHGELRIVAANLTGDNAQAGDDVGDLVTIEPDILVLLEANVHAARRFDEVEAELPNAVLGPRLGESRVAVFSRYPVEQIDLPAEVGTPRIVAVEVEAPEPFTLVAAHLPRPWLYTSLSEATPSDRRAQIAELAEWLASIDGPVVLTGDLNSTDRGVGYRTLLERGNLVDAMRVEWASTTSTKWWPLLLRIDHVMVRGICPVASSNLALPGSDHRGVVADLGPC